MLLFLKVRARLGKKLQVKQKSAFAFNFAIDSAADELPSGEACSEGGAGERGSFRFGFTPTDTSDAASSAPREAKARGVGGGGIPRAAQDFVVEVEGRRAQPSGKNKPKKKKGAGKKKKGAKAKGKPAEKVLLDPAGKEHPRQDSATKPPTTTVSSTPAEGGGEGRTSDDGASLAEASGVVGEETTKKNIRPPPGFTLESWKDPALTVEERRRRRFGSGVRNMAAIQRSSDARRGLVADGEVEGEESRGTHRELVLPERDRGRGVGLVQPAASGGGPSVFSFGFNIDVSFNGGS